ncbi:DUF4157 domain-containing protein [Embleya sp. NPDC005971]|uniref:eCIS core domain-containing protein n=2 Tax=unclassified Embleya TaxID=2699296 RepID=UPI0033E90CE3
MASGPKAGGGAGAHLPAALESRTEHARPLDASVRAPMERSFGASLGDVVVHTDAEAAASADRLDAKAYAVGRHVVFGPGRYDPHSPAGRALIGHELAHVLQQRRGGPAPGPDGVHPSGTAAEGAAHGAGARAAAGLSAPVAGGTAAGVSRAPKGEEDQAAAKAEARALNMQNLGMAEGVLLELAGIPDTLVGFVYSVQELRGQAVDRVTSDLDLSAENRARVRATSDALAGAPVLDAVRDWAKTVDLVDPTTHAPTIAPLVTAGGDWVEKKYDQTFGTTRPQNDDLFTDRELYEIFGQLGAKVVLTALDVEVVKTALAAVNIVGAIKPIIDAFNRIPHGGSPTEEFWTAVVAAVLTVAGMRAGGANKKIARLLIDLALAGVTLKPLVVRMAQDWARAPGADRDAALKQDAKDLAKAVLALLHQILLQAALSRTAKARGEGAPAAGSPKAGKEESTAPTQPRSGGEPRTPLDMPAPPVTAPAVVSPTPAVPAAAPKAGGTKPTVTNVPGKAAAKRTGHTSQAVTPVPAAGTAEQAGATSASSAKAEPGPAGSAGSVEQVPVPKAAPVKAPVKAPSVPPAKAASGSADVGEAQHGAGTAAPAPAKAPVPKAKAAAAQKASDGKAAAAARKEAAAKKVADRKAATGARKEAAAARKEAAAKKVADRKAATAARKEDAAKKAADKKAATAARKEAAAKKAADRKAAADRAASAKAAPKTTEQAHRQQLKEAKARAKESRAGIFSDEDTYNRLKTYYEGQSDRVLAALEKSGDSVAGAVLTERYRRRSGADVERERASEYRPPHQAHVVVVDDETGLLVRDGTTIHSGGVGKARRAEVGMRQANDESHTEFKAVHEIPLKPGQTMHIIGQYDPCGPCVRAMRQAANRTGGRITYWWQGAPDNEALVFEPASPKGKKP